MIVLYAATLCKMMFQICGEKQSARHLLLPLHQTSRGGGPWFSSLQSKKVLRGLGCSSMVSTCTHLQSLRIVLSFYNVIKWVEPRPLIKQTKTALQMPFRGYTVLAETAGQKMFVLNCTLFLVWLVRDQMWAQRRLSGNQLDRATYRGYLCLAGSSD